MGRSVVFVDLPQLINGKYKVDFFELFMNLRSEFDDVRAYVRLPSIENNGKGTKIMAILAKAGVLPMLCPCDPDPIIATEICEFALFRGYNTIAILSGDSGYFRALEFAKKKGKKTMAILPPDSESKLLMDVADDFQHLEAYTFYTLKDKFKSYSILETKRSEDMMEKILY